MVVSEIVICLYSLTASVGVFFNLAFAYKVWTNKVSRNPLLLGMMISDLSVCAISCPIKTYRSIYQPRLKTVTEIILLEVFEGLPASCATLSMMCVAADRCCIVYKCQPLSRTITRKKCLPYIVGITWIIASFMVLLEVISSFGIFTSFYLTVIVLKVLLINGVPILTVVVSHLFLYLNLTAVSLTARARHGELPLPVPIMQTEKVDNRKTHVIIVSGMSKPDKKSSEIGAIENTVPSNIRHRKRLGYFLLLMALCFFFMWMPFTTCKILDAVFQDSISYGILDLTQCIGMLHSGLNPFLSIVSLDRDWNKGLFTSCRKLYEVKEDNVAASSTNEDALGPFNPKIIKPNIKPKYDRRNSSIFIF